MTVGSNRVDRTQADVHLHPCPNVARSVLIAALIAGLPLFAVLYWLAAAHGNWPRVLILNAAALLVGLALWILYRTSYVRVDSTALTVRSLVRRTTVPRGAIAAVEIAHTWRSASFESEPQLLVLDRDGTCLTRLRGAVWSLESMRTVAASLDVPIVEQPDTVTLRELFAQHPTSRKWFEGHLWTGVAGVTTAFVAAFVVTSWIRTAIGTPAEGMAP